MSALGDDLEIHETLSPSTSEIDFLTEKINEESRAQNIRGDAYPFGVFLRRRIKNEHAKLSGELKNNDDDPTTCELIGGCNGSIIYGSIYTDQLWIHSEVRGKGLGKILMEKVHELGKRNQCTFATVGTMSFQGAQSFYEKLGYQVEFVTDGYVNGGKLIHLKKYL